LSVLSHLPREWKADELQRLCKEHRASVEGVLDDHQGLRTLIENFLLGTLANCSGESDFQHAPVATNCCSLLTVLLEDLPKAFNGADKQRVRTELVNALGHGTDAIVAAAKPQLDVLVEMVKRVLSTLHRLALKPHGRVVLLELPVGNSIPCKMLHRTIESRGFRVLHVRVSAPRKGAKRREVVVEELKHKNLGGSDLVLYVDEWWSGSNFDAVCDAIEKARSAVGGFHLLPVALLASDSHQKKRYESLCKKHDRRLSGLSPDPAHLRLAVPALMGRITSRHPFFWSEHDRTSGYRKMQYWGSIFSSLDVRMAHLSKRPQELLAIRDALFDEREERGETVPPETREADDEWVSMFTKSYEAYKTSVKAQLERLEDSSNLAEVEDPEAAMDRLAQRLANVVEGTAAANAVKLTLKSIRLRGEIDPENRFFFDDHCAVVAKLGGDLGEYHRLLMDRIHRYTASLLDGGRLTGHDP